MRVVAGTERIRADRAGGGSREGRRGGRLGLARGGFGRVLRPPRDRRQTGGTPYRDGEARRTDSSRVPWYTSAAQLPRDSRTPPIRHW